MILKFDRPHHLPKLHDELLAAVPALRPQPGPSGELEPRLILGGDGKKVEAIVPDDLPQEDVATIEAVVNAHDPTPPPPPPDPDEELAKAIEQARSLDELKAALLGRMGKARAKGEPVPAG